MAFPQDTKPRDPGGGKDGQRKGGKLATFPSRNWRACSAQTFRSIRSMSYSGARGRIRSPPVSCANTSAHQAPYPLSPSCSTITTAKRARRVGRHRLLGSAAARLSRPGPSARRCRIRLPERENPQQLRLHALTLRPTSHRRSCAFPPVGTGTRRSQESRDRILLHDPGSLIALRTPTRNPGTRQTG